MTIDGTQQGERRTVVKVFSFIFIHNKNKNLKSKSFCVHAMTFCELLMNVHMRRYLVTRRREPKCIIEDLDWISRSRWRHKNILMKFFERKRREDWCRRFLVDVKSSHRKNFVNWQTFSTKKKWREGKRTFAVNFWIVILPQEQSFDCIRRVGSSFYYTFHHLRSACLFNLFIVPFMTTNEREKGYTRTSSRPISKVFCLPTKQRFNNKKEKISFNHHIS